MKEMSEEELLIFMLTQVEAGKPIADAMKTAQLVDDLLTLKKVHLLGSTIKRGRFRNGKMSKDMQRLTNLLEGRMDVFLEEEGKGGSKNGTP